MAIIMHSKEKEKKIEYFHKTLLKKMRIARKGDSIVFRCYRLNKKRMFKKKFKHKNNEILCLLCKKIFNILQKRT